MTSSPIFFLHRSARSPSYAFVDDFAALRSQISDPTSLANFDYWLNTFEYVRSIAQVRKNRSKVSQTQDEEEEIAKESESDNEKSEKATRSIRRRRGGEEGEGRTQKKKEEKEVMLENYKH